MMTVWMVLFFISAASVAYGANEQVGFWSYFYIMIGMFNASFCMSKAVNKRERK